MQETVVDGVGSLLGRLLQFAGELIPVGAVGFQVGFHPSIQLASDGPVGLRIGGVEGIAQVDEAQQGGRVGVGRVITAQARKNGQKVALILPGNIALVGDLVEDRRRYQTGRGVVIDE